MSLLISGLALEIDAGSLMNYPPAHQSRSTVPAPAPAPAPAAAPASVKRPREEQDEPKPEPLVGFYFDVHRPKAAKREEYHQYGSRESPIQVEDDADQPAIKEEKDDFYEPAIKREEDDSRQTAIKKEKNDSDQATIKKEEDDFREAAIKREAGFDDEEEAMRESEGFLPLKGYSDQTNEYIKRENDRPKGEKGPAVAKAAPEFPLCPEQQHALDLAMQGHSLFITG